MFSADVATPEVEKILALPPPEQQPSPEHPLSSPSPRRQDGTTRAIGGDIYAERLDDTDDDDEDGPSRDLQQILHALGVLSDEQHRQTVLQRAMGTAHVEESANRRRVCSALDDVATLLYDMHAATVRDRERQRAVERDQIRAIASQIESLNLQSIKFLLQGLIEVIRKVNDNVINSTSELRADHRMRLELVTQSMRDQTAAHDRELATMGALLAAKDALLVEADRKNEEYKQRAMQMVQQERRRNQQKRNGANAHLKVPRYVDQHHQGRSPDDSTLLLELSHVSGNNGHR
jgi:hypothetical protein